MMPTQKAQASFAFFFVAKGQTHRHALAKLLAA
jgi:hypothetical protein